MDCAQVGPVGDPHDNDP